MIDFAEPPRRQQSRWFETPTVPRPLAAPTGRRRWGVPVGIAGVLLTGAALLAQLPSPRPRDASLFAATRSERAAERQLRTVIGNAPTLTGVRAAMATAQVFCRDAQGAGRDSLLVCLGDAVRFDQAYTRMGFRFVSRGDSVVQVVVCPALIASNKAPAPAVMRTAASPTLHNPSCWRNPENRTHTTFTYAKLTEAGTFTTAPDPDAPRMRIESAATPDTLHVIW